MMEAPFHKFHSITWTVELFDPHPGLFVIVSWMSFLITMDEIGGRMGLLVILFLLLVNIFNTVATNTPKVCKYDFLYDSEP